MEKWIEDLFSKELLEDAARLYNADASNAKKLGDFENYVFEVHKSEKPFILRLTHSSHRSKSDVEAELQWINFLHKNGVSVSLVHKSKNDRLVEEFRVGNSFFYVCLFDKAPGKPVSVRDELFGKDIFEIWGKVTGKMHQVTKDYVAENYRERWDEEDLFDFEKYLDTDKDQTIISEAKELLFKIKELPETKNSFGLIHSDIHPGNFFYHEGQIHVFDFDDSSYHFFISDVAIPLYYTVWFKLRNESLEVRSHLGEELLYHFLRGYKQENTLADEWIRRIPLFLKLRDFVLYTVFHKKFDLQNMDPTEKEILNQIGERLVRGELIVDVDYEKIIQRLEGTN